MNIEISANHSKLEKDSANVRPKYLWLLMISYTMALFASNWFDPRHIQFLGLCTGAGSIAFPFTYLFADIITEVYGFKNTRVAILTGLLFLSIFVLYGQFVIYFLSPNSLYATTLGKYLSVDKYIIIAAAASYLTAESSNSYLLAKLKIIFKGKYMGLRFILSTLFAYLIDEVVYAPIAFHTVILNLNNLIHHMIDSCLFMFSIELLLMPIAIRLAKNMKKIERCDIYDTQTKFTLFSLENNYNESANKYFTS